MTALTLTTAVRLANDTFESMNIKFPWSFVATPDLAPHEMKLRLIHVGAPHTRERERVEVVSYANTPHGFANLVRRTVAGMHQRLRDEIDAEGWKKTS